jgi:hypothetical protein
LIQVSRFRALQACSQGELYAGLCPVATVAAWITRFRPELGYGSKLNIAVVGAEQQDTIDEGRWYGFLGYLLGNESLHTRVTFVGPSLYRSSDIQPVPTPGGIWRTDAARSLAELGFKKATAHSLDAGTFAGMPEAADVDLIVMFNPGLESDNYSWFEPGQLSALCSLGKPIAITGYAEDEQLQEAYLMRAWGYEPLKETAINPFIAADTPVGAWSQVLWSIKSGPVDATREPDYKMLEQHERYQDVAQNILSETGMPFSPSTGKLVPIRAKGTQESVDSQLILLPESDDDGRLAIGVSSGAIYSVRNGVGALSENFEGLEVPPELLQMYDVRCPYAFEHILWALDIMDWLARRCEEAEDDEALQGVRDFAGIDMAEMARQLTAIKGDKRMMANPELRAMAEAMEEFSQLFDTLPPQMQKRLEKGTADFPTRQPFEPTKGAEAFFHALESENWTRATDQLQARPELAHALNRHGANASMAAASANQLDLLAKLAQAGTDFNVQDDELFAPLHEAARRGFPDAVSFLLEHGANPDPVSRYGWTPLLMMMNGRMGGSPEDYSKVALTLLKHGADARRKNAAGRGIASLIDAFELSEEARQALKAATV